jgi:hypothetical protein
MRLEILFAVWHADKESLMDEIQMVEIVENFSRKISPDKAQVKVIRVPDYKTIYIEQIGEGGRSINLKEYQVDGKSYWAGYSSRSETVFISCAHSD